MLNYLSSKSDIRIFILCSNYLYIYIYLTFTFLFCILEILFIVFFLWFLKTLQFELKDELQTMLYDIFSL